MVDKQVIPYLRIAHGTFNTLVMLLFIYQGFLGLKIRKMRLLKQPPPLSTVKKHREMGPVLTFLGVAGFGVGLTLVYLHFGRFFKFPLHFITGSAIALLILGAYFVSRKIKGPDSKWRTPHFVIGVSIICLYVLQAFLGLDILF
jgi:hypothetical protein